MLNVRQPISSYQIYLANLIFVPAFQDHASPSQTSLVDNAEVDLFDLININDEDSEGEEEEIIGYQDTTENTDTAGNLDVDDLVSEDDESPEINYRNDLDLPEELLKLRKDLLGDYQLPMEPPHASYSKPRDLDECETQSLQHYIAWRKSDGTVRAYEEHKKVLQAVSQLEILSLYRVRKLAASLTEFRPTKIDMCPKSCLAYTGEYKDLEYCPHISTTGNLCGTPRFRDSSKKHSRAQVTILPVMDTIKALFSNAEISHSIRHRDRCLKSALDIVGRLVSGDTSTPRTYCDFGDSAMHEYHYIGLGLFQDCRDIAFVLSTDGAQLTMKKHSNTWLLILTILNLPPDIRYKCGVIINLATPGPNSPGLIETFIRPLFEEMAQANEGIWIWGALDSSWFTHRAWIVMGAGDMLGSAKINGMAGHTAKHGDRLTTVQGAKASTKKGAKALYYPMTPPENDKFNPQRPPSYNLTQLPMRNEEDYWKAIKALESSHSKAQKSKITKDTGISRLPLCAASQAFTHPAFFPIDPFHLFYENDMAYIWDLWTIHTKPDEINLHLPTEKAQRFGEAISAAMKTLPPSFCGPVRDPFLKRQSQYKVYEWMALLHWYILPIGMELGLDARVLENFSDFVSAIEFSMTVKSRSDADIASLHATIWKFLIGFEALYVGSNPSHISRVRLCIFQLIHVPIHMKWNGSIRIGSQATVERSIGEVGHKIRSKKAPFAHLASIITEKELLRILTIVYPALSLDSPTTKKDTADGSTTKPVLESHVVQRLDIRRYEIEDTEVELQAIANVTNIEVDELREMSERWGKACLQNQRLLRSQLSDRHSPTLRAYRWFEVSIISSFQVT